MGNCAGTLGDASMHGLLLLLSIVICPVDQFGNT